MTLAIATFNCGNAPASRTGDDLDRIGADLYALQETGDRHPALDSWGKERGFEQVPFDHGAGDTPILFSPRKVHLIDCSAYPVMDRDIEVGPEGAGPTVIHVKYVTHARFRDRESGSVVNVLNNHVVASWTRNDLSHHEEQARRALGKDHISVLVSHLNRLRATSVVTGDFNAEKTFALMKPLADAVDLGSTEPTEGNRVIDFVGVRGKRVTHVQRQVIKGTSSDHNPVVARLHLV